ncbi:hypothetical protein SEA_RASPUTIA_64 [Microbacterium phage Rasputia]|nr:hypothetical protein SEA_RASPUTIA_64 [Microbacterium phage Rasputia]
MVQSYHAGGRASRRYRSSTMERRTMPQGWVNVGEADWITPGGRFAEQRDAVFFDVYARSTRRGNGTPVWRVMTLEAITSEGL